MDAEHFRLLSGGKPSRKCGIMSSGNHLFFSEDGLRMLVANDLDLSNARYSYNANTETITLHPNLTTSDSAEFTQLKSKIVTFSHLPSAGLFSFSCVWAVVKLLQTLDPSLCCYSSLWMEV